MKALVLEIKGDQAAVLDQDGVFRVIEDQDFQVGQEIEIGESLVEDNNIVPFRPKNKLKRMKNIAAAVAVLVTVTAASLFIPSAEVKASGDTQITYKMNVWGQVIDVQGDNEKGEEIAKDIHVGIFGKKIDDVMAETFDLMEKRAGDDEMEEIHFEASSYIPTQKKQVDDHIKDYKEDWNKRRESRQSEVSDESNDASLSSTENQTNTLPDDNMNPPSGNQPDPSDTSSSDVNQGNNNSNNEPDKYVNNSNKDVNNNTNKDNNKGNNDVNTDPKKDDNKGVNDDKGNTNNQEKKEDDKKPGTDNKQGSTEEKKQSTGQKKQETPEKKQENNPVNKDTEKKSIKATEAKKETQPQGDQSQNRQQEDPKKKDNSGKKSTSPAMKDSPEKKPEAPRN